MDKNSSIVSMIKKLKLKDAGYTRPKIEETLCESPVNRVSYPNLYLNSKNAPDLKGYDTGDDVTIVIKGKVTGHDSTKRKNYNSESFDIEIRQLTCLGKKK